MTKKNTPFTSAQMQHVAQLANLELTDTQAKKLATAFTETMEVVNRLQQLDISSVEPTHQVTGLTNRWREDEVDKSQEFTQEEALHNAAHTHNGYFVVPRIVNQDS